ncbi:MAG: RluA family pseudouridine synthase [Candidatus Riflebacteria bacterium]|nr:RluA family pseudouridine synthase [Candidatus Riflebacteria bacterium]
MIQTKQWQCDKEHISARLDQTIPQIFPELTRSKVQNLLKAGHLTVNGENTKAGYKLKEGDEVLITIYEPVVSIEPTKLDFPVIYEDEHIIVVDKPYGLVVHPGAGKEKESVVSALLSHTNLSPIGLPLRPGIVHRLDKTTSGLMVLAKTDFANQKLSKAFASRKVKKLYRAIVEGHPVNERGRIKVALARDSANRKRMKAVAPEKGKMGLSAFKVEKYLARTALVKVSIMTGRTHQIRVHMAFTGHPLLGDIIYGGKKHKDIPGIFLHSAKLEFKHPVTDETMTFKAPLPATFKEALNKLS